MSKEIIQDWTDSTVLLKFGQHKDVRYQVYRDGRKLLQEIRDEDDEPIYRFASHPFRDGSAAANNGRLGKRGAPLILWWRGLELLELPGTSDGTQGDGFGVRGRESSPEDRH